MIIIIIISTDKQNTNNKIVKKIIIISTDECGKAGETVDEDDKAWERALMMTSSNHSQQIQIQIQILKSTQGKYN